MDNLITKVIKKAIKEDLYFAIDCEQGYEFTDKYFYQHPTQDITKLCASSNNNIKYTGIDNLDSCYIFLFTKKQAKYINDYVENNIIPPEKISYLGWIRWDNWNEGVERIADYTTNLDDYIKLDKICEQWDNKLKAIMS